MTQQPKPATNYTAKANRDAASQYDFTDRQDYTDVDRGLIARIPGGKIVDDQGVAMHDESKISYITNNTPCPDSVNPSLWRQSQLNKTAGLYKVCDGLYQVRFDAHVTIVDAPDGLVIIDTTTSPVLAKAGLELFRKELHNEKPVVSVIYTHTHFDHFGGVKGIVSAEDVKSGKVSIVAPGTIENFNKYALSENIVTGNAMSRRMNYTFGIMLPRNPEGMISIGLTESDDFTNTVSYIPPTDGITQTGEKRNLGGWEFEFLYAPDTEAPEEMHIWIPAIKALTCAENANHSMHNIQTIRGARTRDAANFAKFLDETLVRWGDAAEVHFGPHTWPVFGNENVREFLSDQRDMYKYIHDQALRLANQGLTPLEAAEKVKLPDSIGKKWYNRYYHGGLHHNIRAVFHKELGFWDGDPATIWPLLPRENAQMYVDLIGRDKILAEGKKAIEAGEYRKAIEILHNAVFANPDDTEAKNLQADAYEQFGYQMEVPQYRAIFLTAAMELRGGINRENSVTTVSQDTILAMPMEMLFDFAAVHVIGDKTDGVNFAVNVDVTDIDEKWHFWVGNGVLNARPGEGTLSQLTVRGDKPFITAFLTTPKVAKKLIADGKLTVDGDQSVIDKFVGIMDEFDPAFNISTP